MARPRLNSRRTLVPKRPLQTRPPLDRMRQIFRAIKSGKFPNRHRLAADIEVTTKTIQRDLDFMRERLRLPIANDQDGGGYRYTQPISSFPMVELTEAELVSVFIGQKALSQYKGTPFEAPLRSALEKLTSNLSGRLTMSWNDLDALVSFKSFDLSPVDLTTFQTVSEAVRRSVELTFDYRKLDAAELGLLSEIGATRGLFFLKKAYHPAREIPGKLREKNLLPADVSEGFIGRVLEKRVCTGRWLA